MATKDTGGQRQTTTRPEAAADSAPQGTRAAHEPPEHLTQRGDAAGAPLRGPGDRPQGRVLGAMRLAGGERRTGAPRPTAGNMIAQRDIEKVFRSYDFSCVGISGVAGTGLELVRLFQLELEHYEKLEGRTLSLEGKANRLATFVRGNLAGAMQGLVVVPLFAGYDEDTGIGRIFSYTVDGGPYEEHRFYGIGAGPVLPRRPLTEPYTQGMPEADAVTACIQAPYSAPDT